MTLKELKREIEELGVSDKAEILRLLVAELETEIDEDVEKAWLEEAQRRYKELLAGTAKAVPAELVFETALARLRE